ncbi:hypothetical protein Cni_G13778 [Canna indica]|uniref:DUF1677 family protein n=1 Tax=Canna indica TaxID=4628 RepID=A0AAQ3QE23_9LILI|nr:hypothetical protein Cni_G13778 [Canna indica]
MDIESVKCECCGLREDCTKNYISSVKALFDGKWLCGLCSEVVKDESRKQRRKSTSGVEEAIKAHSSFCSESKLNPVVGVADGIRQILRRRSADFAKVDSAVLPKKYGRMEISS